MRFDSVLENFRKGIRLAAVFGFICMLAACSKSKSAGTGSEPGLSDTDLALQNQNRWGDNGNIPRASSDGPFADVFFEYDSSTIQSDDIDRIQGYAAELKKDPLLHAEIEGHCDKRGTPEYNLALGERRSKAVAAVLSRFGVSGSQLSYVSYGEEVPLVPGDSEDAYAKNRRAHFAVYRKNTTPAR